MARQNINVGTSPNDGTGDVQRDAWIKTNDNFQDLYLNKEELITPGTPAQYYRGDKTWATLNRTVVGLGQVDNTADLDKPVSTAQNTAILAREAQITPGTTGQYFRGDKTWAALNKAAVGLGNVDNTADLDKPISTATKTGLDGKAALIHQHAIAEVQGLQNALDLKAPTQHAHVIQDVTGLQTALDGKANQTQIIRAVRFFMRANLVASNPAADVVTASFTVDPQTSVARAQTPNTQEVTLTIKKNGANVGTVVFPANNTVGQVSMTVGTVRNLVPGDLLEVYPPATGVDNLALVTIVVRN